MPNGSQVIVGTDSWATVEHGVVTNVIAQEDRSYEGAAVAGESDVFLEYVRLEGETQTPVEAVLSRVDLAGTERWAHPIDMDGGLPGGGALLSDGGGRVVRSVFDFDGEGGTLAIARYGSDGVRTWKRSLPFDNFAGVAGLLDDGGLLASWRERSERVTLAWLDDMGTEVCQIDLSAAAQAGPEVNQAGRTRQVGDTLWFLDVDGVGKLRLTH